MATCSQCGKTADLIDGNASLCGSCRAKVSIRQDATSETSGSTLPPEFDHRGIRLPARTRVGGIIIPQ
jgi:hypothetical protein